MPNAEANIINLQYPVIMMDNETIRFPQANPINTVIFEQVFKNHFKSLHGYAISIVKDETSAEEIVQNVFYKLWEKREKLEIRQSLKAYLYSAVYNESINYLKHVKVEAAYQKHETITNNGLENRSDPAAHKELQLKIDGAINELPEKCRTIFQLSRFEDMKYRAIAAHLGISVKTVETQMGKALRQLRSKLSEFLPVVWLILISIQNLIQ